MNDPQHPSARAGGRPALAALAVAVVGDDKVELVVLDLINEPGTGGLETCSQITARRPVLRAVIASGSSASEEVRQAHRLGAGPYLRKPDTLRQVGSLVKTELER